MIEQIKCEEKKDNEYFPQNYIEFIEKIRKSDETEIMDLTAIIKETKSSSGIEDILIQTDTKDDGGIIAMSGFYFQLLVTIKYVLEMFEGKWTKIVVDHHQDIIAFNDKTVRFIQVKTKNNEACLVSASRAYLEWIPKLLQSQEMFDEKEYSLEYELVSNCYFINSKSKCTNFENYYHNDKFENGLIEGDLYECVKEKLEKSSLTDEGIKNGLKAFRVLHLKATDFEKILCHDIGMYFDKNYRADQSVIDMFISHLFKKCYFPEHAKVQIVDNEDMHELKDKIYKRIQTVGEKTIIDKSVNNIVGDYVEQLKKEYQITPIYPQISELLEEMGNEFITYIQTSEMETVLSVVSKFTEKTTNSQYFRTGKMERLIEESQKLLRILLILKIGIGGEISFDANSKKLLLVNITDSPFNLFGIRADLGSSIEDAVHQFQDIFRGLSFDEQVSIISNPMFRIIVTGEFDNEGEIKDFLEVTCKEFPKNESLKLILDDKNESLTTVKNKIRIIDAEESKLNRIHRKRKSYTDIREMKNEIVGGLYFDKYK